MTDINSNKQLILDYFAAVEKSTSQNITEAVSQFIADDYHWYGVYPFEEQSDAQITVFGALYKLPDEQRDAILLTDIEGFSEEEAAKQLGVAAGTIKSRRSRGRAKLAELLADLNPKNMEPTPPGARHIDGGE